MNIKRVGIFGAGLLVMGSLAMAASNATWKAVMESEKGKTVAGARSAKNAPAQAKGVAIEAPGSLAASKLELVPPPAELPRAPAGMGAPTMTMGAVAPEPAPAPAVAPVQGKTATVAAVQAVSPKSATAKPVAAKSAMTAKVPMKTTAPKVGKTAPALAPAAKLSVVKADDEMSDRKVPLFGSAKADIKAKLASITKEKAQAAPSTAVKPGKLFSYVRLLNYSPHPQQEEFLQEKPLALNGKHYHISVAYREDWNVLGDEDAQLKKLGFDINLYENGKVVRTLKIPSTALDGKTVKKGLVLGLAEVAPYKFKIAVDSFTLKDKGIADITFKFDMTS